MISIKNEKEIKYLEIAGEIVGNTHKHLQKFIAEDEMVGMAGMVAAAHSDISVKCVHRSHYVIFRKSARHQLPEAFFLCGTGNGHTNKP